MRIGPSTSKNRFNKREVGYKEERKTNDMKRYNVEGLKRRSMIDR